MKIHTKIRSLKGILFVLFLTFSATLSAELVMVLNEENVVELNQQNVINIFLDKTDRFPNGTTAVPVNQPEGSLTSIAFNRTVLRMSQNKLKKYWAKKRFSGRAHPPKVLENDKAVLDFVRQNKSAIGYVDSESITDEAGLLVIRRLEKK